MVYSVNDVPSRFAAFCSGSGLGRSQALTEGDLAPRRGRHARRWRRSSLVFLLLFSFSHIRNLDLDKRPKRNGGRTIVT